MAALDIPFGRPWIEDADREAVLEVLNGHILTHGPNCKAFEDEYAAMMGSGFATSTSSCMAALHLSCMDLGLGPGDDVLVPAMTHVATVHAVELTGATPVFVDCELTTGNMDLDQLEAAVTSRSKAILVVHYVGIPCDMARVMAIAGEHGLKVIEDCALAVGARYDGTHVGLFGHTGCYSFYPVKHITSGEGGMLVSKSQETVERIARFRAFNVDRTHNERKVPGIYDVTGVGMNYRMSEMQAALGRTQLAKLDRILERRAANFQALKAGLAKIEGAHVLDAADPRQMNSHYCAILSLGDRFGGRRDEIILALKDNGVGTSVYYPHPVPRLTYYAEKYGYKAGQCPGAETVSDRSFALPCGPHLSEADMAAVADAVSQAIDDLA